MAKEPVCAVFSFKGTHSNSKEATAKSKQLQEGQQRDDRCSLGEGDDPTELPGGEKGDKDAMAVS